MKEIISAFWKVYNVVGRVVGVLMIASGSIMPVVSFARGDSEIGIFTGGVALSGILLLFAKPSGSG